MAIILSLYTAVLAISVLQEESNHAADKA